MRVHAHFPFSLNIRETSKLKKIPFTRGGERETTRQKLKARTVSVFHEWHTGRRKNYQQSYVTVQKYANSWELFLNGGFEDFLRDFFQEFQEYLALWNDIFILRNEIIYF